MTDPFGCDRLHRLMAIADAIEDAVIELEDNIGVEERSSGTDVPSGPERYHGLLEAVDDWDKPDDARTTATAMLWQIVNSFNTEWAKTPPDKLQENPYPRRENEPEAEWYLRGCEGKSYAPPKLIQQIAAEWNGSIGALERVLFSLEWTGRLRSRLRKQGIVVPLISLRIRLDEGDRWKWSASVMTAAYPPGHRVAASADMRSFAAWNDRIALEVCAELEVQARIDLAHWHAITAAAIAREEKRLQFSENCWFPNLDFSMILGDTKTPMPLQELNETQRTALRLICEAKTGIIGKELANRLGVEQEHLRSNVIPRLRAHGVYNPRNGNGYRVVKR